MSENDERPFEGGDDRKLWDALGALEPGDGSPTEGFAERVVAAARAMPQDAKGRGWAPWAWGGAAAAAALIAFATLGGDPSDGGTAPAPDEDLAAAIRELEELPEEDVLALEAEATASLSRDWLGG